jgi:SEC-C motif-containing protein
MTYAACCEPFHGGSAAAATALQLMRSRYSAFAVGDADYLLASWSPVTRPASLDLDASIEWRRLQIRGVTGGGEDDDAGTVEFVAHCWDSVRREHRRQHENSRFVREGGRWFYVEPVFLG